MLMLFKCFLQHPLWEFCWACWCCSCRSQQSRMKHMTVKWSLAISATSRLLRCTRDSLDILSILLADQAPAWQPCPEEKISCGSGGAHLDQSTGLPMADENRTNGCMPARDRGFWLPQEWDRVEIPGAARTLARSGSLKHAGVPSHLHWIGHEVLRRSDVDGQRCSAQPGQ